MLNLLYIKSSEHANADPKPKLISSSPPYLSQIILWLFFI
jgi:hypothetical protein